MCVHVSHFSPKSPAGNYPSFLPAEDKIVMDRSMYPILWGSEIFLSGGSKCRELEICVPFEVDSYMQNSH